MINNLDEGHFEQAFIVLFNITNISETSNNRIIIIMYVVQAFATVE